MITGVANKPRVEIGMDGFVRRTIFGTRSRRWSDVKGEFAVAWVGPIRAIAYCVTPQFREAAGIKPQPILKGYDEDITGAYSISLFELAELLNEHKRRAAKAS